MKSLVLLLTVFFSLSLFGQELKIPALRSPVMDEAKFLTETEANSLNQKIYEIYANKGPQITVFTVADLQGYSIEDFSIKVAEAWKLGTKEKGDGILMIISKSDRKMRIEVGQGLEGDITDYDASLYIQRVLRPAFKEGLFFEGIDAVISDIAQRFNIKIEPNHNSLVKKRAHSGNGKLVNLLIILFIISLVTSGLFRNKPLWRGLTNGVAAGVVGFASLGIGGIMLAGVFALLGFGVGLIGINNILYALAASQGRGGFYGGSGGGSGGGWSGGGGGFSGGGSSGGW